MLSRVEELEQIYILNEIKEEKIKPAPKALEELLKMNQRSVNSNPIPWKQREGNYVNIAHLNCMNLMNTFEEIKCDYTLLESSIICLSETWLEDSKDCPKLTGYKNCANFKHKDRIELILTRPLASVSDFGSSDLVNI